MPKQIKTGVGYMVDSLRRALQQEVLTKSPTVGELTLLLCTYCFHVG